MSAPSRGWLVLLVLLLVALPASAQRRRSNRPAPEEMDPVCRKAKDLCWKFIIGADGGALLSTRGVSGGIGGKVAATIPFPTFEVGLQSFGLADLGQASKPYVGSGEVLLRIVRVVDPDQRLFFDLAGGISLYTPSTAIVGFRFAPSLSAGVSYEVASYSSGLHLSAAFTVLRADHWTAIPHVGLGFFL